MLVWDETKNRENQRKHGVSFEEAGELFTAGVEYLELFDQAHSDAEDRFIGIGPISHGVVLVVWTQPDEETVRLISARRATRRERVLYETTMERCR
jgi:uncharacterized DUF497 family protein